MNEINEFFSGLLSPNSWPARWHCGRWTPFHGWLYILSSISIALAYFSIPIILFYVLKKSKNKLPFQKVFWLFFLFILACGITHVFDALMFWYPVYRVSAIALFATAIISWMAVVGLYKVIPVAMAFKSPATLEQIIQTRTSELQQSNKYLTDLNRQLEESQQLSQKLIKEKDEFLSIASHELKTPVTTLKGYTQILLLDSTNNELSKANIVKIDEQTNKLTRLISDLLDSTKLQDGILTYNKTKFLMNELVESASSHFRLITHHNIIIETNNALCYVIADVDRMEHVINNLLANAIKFSQGASEIHVRIYTDDKNAVCCVRDFGLGIPEEDREIIFEKFYRVKHPGYATYPGFGLGLFIAKEVVNKHDGKIWVESEIGKGSSFYFALPLASSNT
jgi:chemotaxis family two-component system sensor kinase Cph1